MGCKKLRNSWIKEGYTGNTFSKIAIIGVSQNEEERKLYEQHALFLLNDLGVEIIMGTDLFSDVTKMTDSLIEKKIIEAQLDGIITISLVSSELYRYNDVISRFSQFYVRRYDHVNSLSSFRPTTRWVMEGVLYDLVESDNLVWKGEMALLDPENNLKAKQRFIRRMVFELKDEDIIRSPENVIVHQYGAL
jgi:hypothetical protein